MGVAAGSARNPSPDGCGSRPSPGTYLHSWCLLPPGLLEHLGQSLAPPEPAASPYSPALFAPEAKAELQHTLGGWAACPGSRWDFAKNERQRTGSDPTGMPSSIWSRTMRPWSSSACRLAHCSRMKSSQPVLLLWATGTWDHTPSKLRG